MSRRISKGNVDGREALPLAASKRDVVEVILCVVAICVLAAAGVLIISLGT